MSIIVYDMFKKRLTQWFSTSPLAWNWSRSRLGHPTSRPHGEWCGSVDVPTPGVFQTSCSDGFCISPPIFHQGLDSLMFVPTTWLRFLDIRFDTRRSTKHMKNNGKTAMFGLHQVLKSDLFGSTGRQFHRASVFSKSRLLTGAR